MKTTGYKHEARDLERLAANIAKLTRRSERWAKAARKVERLARLQGIRAKNETMAETYDTIVQSRLDARDLQAIHDAVKEGDYRKAVRLARRLDTAVRDEIPLRLYNAIHDERS